MHTHLSRSAALTALFVVCTWSAPSRAGILIANEYGGEKQMKVLRLLRQEVVTVVDNQVAHTTVTQVFVNDTGTRVEGLYMARLPEDAGVISFAHWVNGKKIEGRLEEKQKAREIYADAQRRELAPALLEYAGGNKFQMKLDEIAPGAEKKVELIYSEILPYASGIVTYRLPIAAPVGIRGTIELLTFTLSVRDAKDITATTSPWPCVAFKKESPKSFNAVCSRTAVPMDEDLAVLYTINSSDLGATLLFYRPDEKLNGFFMLMVAPQEVTESRDIARKDIVFVFDISGSMEGHKMEQARSALKLCLANMNADDGLNIIGFSSDINEYRNKIATLSAEARASSNRFVETLEAGGGTNIDLALEKAFFYLGRSEHPERPKVIIFLTDGQGDGPPQDTLAKVRKWNTGGTRIFAFGVGDDVNTTFLEELGTANRGGFVYVKQADKLEEVVSKFYASIAKPVLTDMELDFGEVTTRRLYPQVIPDVYKGHQVIIAGLYDGTGSQKVTVRGSLNGQKRNFVVPVDFPAKETEHAFIARIWGKRRADDLERLIRKEGEKKEYVEEIIALSKKYQFATPYTSFIAVEQPPVVAQDQGTNQGVNPAQPKTPALPQGKPKDDQTAEPKKSGTNAYSIPTTQPLSTTALGNVGSGAGDSASGVGGAVGGGSGKGVGASGPRDEEADARARGQAAQQQPPARTDHPREGAAQDRTPRPEPAAPAPASTEPRKKEKITDAAAEASGTRRALKINSLLKRPTIKGGVGIDEVVAQVSVKLTTLTASCVGTLTQFPASPVNLMISLNVGADGKVTFADARGGDEFGAPFVDCVRRILKGLVFKGVASATQVTFELTLELQ